MARVIDVDKLLDDITAAEEHGGIDGMGVDYNLYRRPPEGEEDI